MTTTQTKAAAAADPAPSTVLDIDADVVRTAIDNAVTAVEPHKVGEHGLAFLVPEGWRLEVQDERKLSPDRLPEWRNHVQQFVGVRSLAAYVNRHKHDERTVGYIVDVNGKGTAPLLGDLTAAFYVLDDIPAGTEGTARRGHRAELVLRPTAAARRWGGALSPGKRLAQDRMLDLVVEGIGEIAEPAGAVLRDLISDLHAIRTTSAKSVKRTGGQTTVEVADNVSLHAGTGNTVEVPETLTIVLAPFAGIGSTLTTQVLIRPHVDNNGAVSFELAAPGLDDQLARILGEVAADLSESTAIEPLWVP